MENIANGDAQLAHGSGSVVTLGTFVITSTPNTKVKSFTKGVFSEKISFSFSGGNGPGCVPGSVTATGDVMASATKCKELVSNKFVCRENDQSTTGPFIGKDTLGHDVNLENQPVKVSNAGQTKHKAN